MEKLQFGLIGCGNMGLSLATAAQALDHTEVSCVCDLDEERGRSLAEDLKTRFEPDPRVMVQSEDVQAVLVATPGHLHEEPVITAAEAGVHIFCEKPLSVTTAGCDRMIEAAEKHGVKMGVGLVCRFHPVHGKLRDLAHNGELGSPTCLSVHRLWGGTGPSWTAAWRQERALSGGNLMEVNAHEIDFMRFVLGDVTQVYAVGGTYIHKEADFPDIALVTLNFKSGAVGHLHSSAASAMGGYGARLDCTEGSAVIPSFWGSEGGIRHRRRESEEIVSLSLSDLGTGEDPVRREIRAFADAILKGDEPPVGSQEGRAATEVALAAYLSIETGLPVRLPLEDL